MSSQAITLLTSETKWNLADLFTCQLTAINRDWSGASLAFSFNYCLLHSCDRLYFGCKSNGHNARMPNTAKGQFVEGLWKYTVVELFLGEKNSDEYLEFNLSPDGAWWACAFRSYRERSGRDLASLEVETFSRALDNNFWECALSFPLPRSELDLVTCNVTAIIGHEEQIFLAAKAKSEQEPDFHLKEIRQPPKILSVD